MQDNEEMVPAYEAAGLAEAKLFSDRLANEGIANYLDNVESPLDGLTAGEQTVRVMVRSSDAQRAAAVLKQFLDEQQP